MKYGDAVILSILNVIFLFVFEASPTFFLVYTCFIWFLVVFVACVSEPEHERKTPDKRKKHFLQHRLE